MRKILAVLLSVVAAVALSLTWSGAAHAADNVDDTRCTPTTTSLGEICVTVIFDDTNCEPNSLYNCSGLNGAKIAEIYIFADSGNIATDDLLVTVDQYGDGTTAYTGGYWVDFTQAGGSNTVYAIVGNITKANRVCVRVRSQTANRSSGVNVGGMNPYGLSRAGSCPDL